MAISSSSSARPDLSDLEACQPTTMQEYTSITNTT
jgi:hypothetical protein